MRHQRICFSAQKPVNRAEAFALVTVQQDDSAGFRAHLPADPYRLENTAAAGVARKFLPENHPAGESQFCAARGTFLRQMASTCCHLPGEKQFYVTGAAFARGMICWKRKADEMRKR